MSTTYNIWADGSYRPETKRLGAGWVTRSNSPDVTEERHAALPRLRDDYNMGSSIAEIMAFTYAIKDIPSGAAVHVRMDCADVVSWIKKGAVSSQKARNSLPLMDAFAEAMAHRDRLRQFDISLVTGRQNAGIEAAHKLSRIASSGPKEKRL